MANQSDAQLLMQILRWGSESGVDQAMRSLFSPDFNPETAPMDDPNVAKVLGYGEAIATFVKHDLLDAELVCDLIWVEGLWARTSRHALAVRNEANEPRLYENFEALVEMTAKVAVA
jgi:hypothetical protein